MQEKHLFRFSCSRAFQVRLPLARFDQQVRTRDMEYGQKPTTIQRQPVVHCCTHKICISRLLDIALVRSGFNYFLSLRTVRMMSHGCDVSHVRRRSH